MILAALDDGVAKSDAIFPLYSLAPAMHFYRREGRHDYALLDGCEANRLSQCLAALAAAVEAGSARVWLVGIGGRDIRRKMDEWLEQGRLRRIAPAVHLLAAGKEIATHWRNQRAVPFDVRFILGENAIDYAKSPCVAPDAAVRFFLHVVPVDRSVLAEDEAGDGFDNLDFSFVERGTLADGECRARVALPDYAISRIVTGQYNSSGRLWQRVLEPPRDAEAGRR